VLGQLPEIVDRNVLVGTANADDAGVYKITDDIAAVFSADFFTPIVDDPYWFGAIAAVNALSDIWAMGGRPVCALNLAGFPGEAEFQPMLKEIIRGGSEKMTEAGVSVIGGHTVKDKEPKFGYAVLGLIHPKDIRDNSMARAGDAMVLTKPLGTGIIATAIRRGVAGKESVEEITGAMAALNKRASEIMLDVGASTATDITGFGFIGHLWEVLNASGILARVHSGRIPYFKDTLVFAEKDVVAGGTKANFQTFSNNVKYSDAVDDAHKILLNDAQTSGGLLIFVPADKKEKLVSALESEKILAAYVGDTFEGEPEDGRRIIVEP
jgi:selenide,water dikinase